MTKVYLAHVHGAQGDNSLIGRKGVTSVALDLRPSILVSYFYLKNFLKDRDKFCIRDWVLDSGAFSAHNSGASISLQEFTETSKRLLSEDKQLVEVFALDVIGDWRASIKNCEAMNAAGVPAIPTWHKGEPYEHLIAIAKDYDKIAIGGLVGTGPKEKMEVVKQCFARVWPKKIHGFGIMNQKILESFPFHSCDATNWEIAPCKFGQWRSFDGKLSWRGGNQDLRNEIKWHLDFEKRLQFRWRKQMAELESNSPTAQQPNSPTAQRSV